MTGTVTMAIIVAVAQRLVHTVAQRRTAIETITMVMAMIMLSKRQTMSQAHRLKRRLC